MGQDKREFGSRVEFEPNPDPENAEYCPGYRETRKPNGYSYLVRCIETHPHQSQIRISGGDRKLVPIHGFLNENTSRGAILTDRKLDELLAIKERRLARRGETKDIQKEIAKRELAKLKAMFSTGQLDHREVNRALQRKTPDVPVAHLPKSLKTLETHCRCGVELTKAQWDDMGMDESPLICPICTDLPSYCKCDSVQEAPKDSPGSGSVPF